MNRSIHFLGAVLLSLATVPLSAVEIKTAYTRYYESMDIRPVLQYFGRSLTGQRFRTVVASNPEEPAGQYFILRLSGTDRGAPAEARMTLLTTAGKEPSEWSWSLEDVELSNWLYLGLTGADWPDEEIQPLAWHIELLNAEGNPVAEWKSFLWEMP